MFWKRFPNPMTLFVRSLYVFCHKKGVWAKNCSSHPFSMIRTGGNKKIQCGNKYLVLCTVSKWMVVVGAKWMVPTACPARVWKIGTIWTILTQHGWVLWFAWYFICTSFQKYHLLRCEPPMYYKLTSIKLHYKNDWLF